MQKREIVLVSGARTAIGAFGGAIRDVTAVDLGALVIREALTRAGLRPEPDRKTIDFSPDSLKGEPPTHIDTQYGNWDDSLKPVQVDEVIMGCVLQGGQGQNPGRRASIYAGIPKETPAVTVNKLCGSGMKAIIMAAQSIATGEAEIVIAGGMESMSNAPYILPKARWGYRMDITSRGELLDLMVFDGLWESFYGYHMGNTAENIASRYGISREEQDQVGALSHQRARAAIASGIFKDEIVPVTMQRKKGDPVIFDTDERPMETSVEKMSKLAPIFRKDGTVTAGNASGVNDAAAAVVVMSSDNARELGLTPMATIKSHASAGVEPAYMGLGIIPAVRKALDRAGLTLNDIDLLELNEAFAAQLIGCLRELNLTFDQTNPNGSGISLGHPIGATGARIITTAMYEMERRDLHYGLVTMCIGGGQGIAMILER